MIALDIALAITEVDSEAATQGDNKLLQSLMGMTTPAFSTRNIIDPISP